jgi:hypothetical protein
VSFQLPIERRGNVNRGANGVRLHKNHYPMDAINMENNRLT